ncbi:MAG TPA: NfeD family protein [Caulobacteraceae bacterium]|jgi:membrane protein implicated in regulation of membrane protease activity|nr:NfeD family protein [Caulobacteraceae bacterium]
MDLVGLYLAHAVWWWVGVAAVLLAVEVATGTGYLLWPAGSAGVVAILTLAGVGSAGWDFVLFAGLTIATTYAGRRWLRRPEQVGPDINDPHHRLVGRHGAAVAAFDRGQGRVFVDGKEWAAEVEGDAALVEGDRIEVARVLDGGRLQVRPASRG